MPDTHRKVKIVTGKDTDLDNVHPDAPIVMVDGKPLYGVTRVKMDHEYGKHARTTAEITLMGVDVNLEAAPKYLVRVVGPQPKED